MWEPITTSTYIVALAIQEFGVLLIFFLSLLISAAYGGGAISKSNSGTIALPYSTLDSHQSLIVDYDTIETRSRGLQELHNHRSKDLVAGGAKIARLIQSTIDKSSRSLNSDEIAIISDDIVPNRIELVMKTIHRYSSPRTKRVDETKQTIKTVHDMVSYVLTPAENRKAKMSGKPSKASRDAMSNIFLATATIGEIVNLCEMFGSWFSPSSRQARDESVLGLSKRLLSSISLIYDEFASEMEKNLNNLHSRFSSEQKKNIIRESLVQLPDLHRDYISLVSNGVITKVRLAEFWPNSIKPLVKSIISKPKLLAKLLSNAKLKSDK